MKTVRTTILGFLTAAVLALVLPFGAALGADKQYTLTVSPATPTASSGPFRFTFTNNGNSSFNSLTLTVPPGWSIPSTAVVTPSRGNATVNTARTEVTVNAINLPTGAGQSMTVDISAVTGTAVCGSQAGQWSAQPWTGSTVGSGQTFKIKGSFPSTTLPSSCFTVTSSSIDTAKGTIAPSGTQLVSAGSQPLFTITPTEAYNIGATGGTCGGTLTGNTFTTAAVNADCTVVANFDIKTFTVQGSPAANVTPTPQTKNHNQTATFTVTAPPLSHTMSASSDTCGGSLSTDKTTFTTGPITANCTVSASFAANTLTVDAPPKVVAGTPFIVTVTGDGPNAGVSLSSTTCDYTTIGTTTSGNTTTVTGSIATVPTTGSCTLTADATGYPSTQKTVSVISGIVSCTPPTGNYASSNGNVDPDLTYLNLSVVNVNDWGLRRGPNLPGGANCENVDVGMIFLDPYTAHFTYDKKLLENKEQKGNFKYMIVWGEVSVDATAPTASWTNKRPKVAWAEKAGQPAWVKSLTCVDDDLNQLSALMPVLPMEEPFLGTTNTPSNADYYPGDSNAAAKALSYLADGTRKAQMCVAQHGWMSMGLDGGVIKVLYWSKIVDQVDAWASIDQ
jgi:hypothetical protein